VGNRFWGVLAIFSVLAAIPTAKANLVFTEQVSINELQSSSDALLFGPAMTVPSLAIGDSLTISYEVSRPSTSPTSDADSVVYDHVRASVRFGSDTLFTTDQAELTVWNLIGFYGIAVNDFSGPLLDFLASSQPDVLSKGFLAPHVSIDAFDSAAGGSVFANGQVIGFQTDSYQFSGDLPSPVPEPASYGALAGLLLSAAVSLKWLRTRHT
jgi:hypothetical protein